MINKSKTILDQNKSFSHSASRYRRRRIHRIFSAGVYASRPSSKIRIIESYWGRFKLAVRHLFSRKPKPGTMSPRAAALMRKYSQPMDSSRSIIQDTKHHTQHKE